jgi:hypothetical protein
MLHRIDERSDRARLRLRPVAQERRERAVQERRSLAFETVSSGLDKVDVRTGVAAKT